MKKFIYYFGALIMCLISAATHKGTILEFSIIVGCSWIGLILVIKADIKD